MVINVADLKALLVFDSFYLGRTEPITENCSFRKQKMFLQEWTEQIVSLMDASYYYMFKELYV